jgi:hypothetical protein
MRPSSASVMWRTSTLSRHTRSGTLIEVTFLGAEPRSFEIAPGSAGVKPRRLGQQLREGAVESRRAWK